MAAYLPYIIGVISCLLFGAICSFITAWVITRNPNLLTRFFDNLDDSLGKAESFAKKKADEAKKAMDEANLAAKVLEAKKAAAAAYNKVINGGK
jgi:hypothetical protein